MTWSLWPRRLPGLAHPVRHPGAADRALVERVRREAAAFQSAADAGLRRRTEDLRELTGGPRDEERLAAAFALVTEAVRRVLGLTLHDGQLLGGLALARGSVAEMPTGEGKTLTAALPAFAHALPGRGVHVMTANAYLARRDFEQLAPVYELLGLSAACLSESDPPAARRSAYAADVTYGTGHEFGFDYLRDQLALRRRATAAPGERFLRKLTGEGDHDGTVQRALAAAVIDEIDSVLVDDAVSPLVLTDHPSGPASDAAAVRAAAAVADGLERGLDFCLDTAAGTVELTEAGQKRIHDAAHAIPFAVLRRPWAEYVLQALRAAHLFRRDVHYAIDGGRVRIVDESTGRIFSDRTWRGGLHQAVEVREGLEPSAESEPLARITRQRYAGLYGFLCGMTGTAAECAVELRSLYGLDCIVIPPRRPCRRTLHPPLVFATADAKWGAVTEEVRSHRRAGRPVLIGTRSIADSLTLSERLTAADIGHQVLNGRQDAAEADVIAAAGRCGCVTVATNMAGRGTDIRPDAAALAAGGLHVIGTEHHDSRRVDRQLVGRAARQGEPGTARFIISADDRLLAHDARLRQRIRRDSRADGQFPFDLTARIERLQRAIEVERYRQRRQLLDEDRRLLDDLARWYGG